MATRPLEPGARPVDTTHALDTLDKFTINGVAPFFSAGDDGDQALDEAHALLTVLSTAFEASELLTTRQGATDGECPISTLRPKIFATAIDGINRLIALGRYRNDIYAETLRASRSVG